MSTATRTVEPTTTPVPARRRPQEQQPVRRPRRGHPVKFTLLAIVAIGLFLPFVSLIAQAFTPTAELGRGWPAHWRWQNIPDALTTIPYAQFALTSTVIAVVYSALTAVSSALVGYGFARLRGPGKQALFAVLISMMIVPQIVTLIPTYLLFSQLGLINTYWPWVLWGMAGAPYAIFLYRQFYAGFPKELEEAARLDGAGRLRTFASIFIPLSRPLIVTAFVISFNATWGDYVAPSLFLNADNSTLAVGIAHGYVVDQGITVPNLLAAGSLLYLIPVIVIFLIAQRSYVRGFVSSGIK